MRRMLLAALGLVMIFFASSELLQIYLASKQGPTVFQPVITATYLPTSTQVPTELPENTPTSLPTATPTPIPVQGYVLDRKVDISSGKSTVLSISLPFTQEFPEGGELVGTWANTIAYQSGDNERLDDPYDVKRGTTYSIFGDAIVMLGHSGQFRTVEGLKWILFASNLDLYLRKTSENFINLSDGQTKVQDLVGREAYLCQSEFPIEPMTVYDPSQGCPGQKVKLEIVAAVLIAQENVWEYEMASADLQTKMWLENRYPEAGFDRLTSENGFIFVTCVQQYPDQTSLPGVDRWVFNRVAVGFRVVPLGE